MKTLVTILLAAAMTAFSLGASAGPDENQHMSMMQKTMGQMQAMKPGENMTPTEQKEWIAEHQKLMELMMGQMMDEHHLMMQMNCK